MYGTPTIKYTIAIKDSIIILSVSGRLLREHEKTIEEAFQQIEGQEFTGVLFEISGVSEIDMYTLPIISRLKNLVKVRNAEMLTCGMSSDIKAFLKSRAILREDHLCKDLPEGFKMLKTHADRWKIKT